MGIILQEGKGREVELMKGFIIRKRNDWKLQGNRLIQKERERVRIISIYGEQEGKNLEEKMERIHKGKKRRKFNHRRKFEYKNRGTKRNKG